MVMEAIENPRIQSSSCHNVPPHSVHCGGGMMEASEMGETERGPSETLSAPRQTWVNNPARGALDLYPKSTLPESIAFIALVEIHQAHPEQSDSIRAFPNDGPGDDPQRPNHVVHSDLITGSRGEL